MVRSIGEAVSLVEVVCRQPGNSRFIKRTRWEAQREGIQRAVRHHDTAALYNWLMTGLSLQGISDAIALGYIAAHGNADWATITSLLAGTRCACPKLGGSSAYQGCSYRKSAQTCARPRHLRLCPVRKLPLRKGGLNVQAFSLYFFLRDRCEGDLVGFIDATISAAQASSPGDWVASSRGALIAAFSNVDGVSAKLASMMLATLLIGGRKGDDDWLQVGASMIAVDTLVHNFLTRTGVLTAFGADHAYGPRCYGPNGCETSLRAIASMIDAREFGPGYPQAFPRFVQQAIWRFCTAGELNVCSLANVRPGERCQSVESCPAGDLCGIGK